MLIRPESSITLNHMAKFLIITSDKKSQITKVAASIFPQLGIINFVLIYLNITEVCVMVSNHFTHTMNIYKSSELLNTVRKMHWKGVSNKLFSNKLDNLNGYTYRIIHHHGMSYAHYIPFIDEVLAKNRYFFDYLAEVQNASIDYITTSSIDIKENQYKILDLMRNRQMDFTISESVISDKNTPKIMTYDEKAICVMIPKDMMRHRVALKPFILVDNILEICIYTTFLFILMTWKIYKNRGAIDSSGTIFFSVFASFTGHSIRLNSKNRRILKIMIQNFILATFFLRSFYESHITSTVIEKSPILKVESIQDLLKHTNLNVSLDITTERMLKVIKDYQNNFERKNLRVGSRYGKPVEEIAKHISGRIIILSCDFVDHYIRKYKNPQHFTIPQHFHSYYLRLDANWLSPFVDYIQNKMNRAFDAGLTQKWEHLYLSVFFGSRSGPLKSLQINEIESSLITLNELGTLFHILLSLSVFYVLVLLAEIFWHGFGSKVAWKSKLNILKQRIIRVWRQRRILKVQRVHVSPINV